MKIAAINMTDSGSTGKIMMQIADCSRKSGHTVKTFSALCYTKNQKPKKQNIPNHSYFGSVLENKIHTVLGMLTGKNGFYSYFGTKSLIKELKGFAPDILHLHNLHKFCINLPLLFKYINKNNIKVVWTLHDCWTFTGHCPYFTMSGCDKWKNGCGGCKNLSGYPKSYIDNTKKVYRLKKKLFSLLKDMTVVTPSNWLKELVAASFLRDYETKVINNGIDLEIFKNTESDFREKYHLQNKKVLLGVAFGFGKRKGLDVFVKLAECLNDSYRIVLVGTDKETEKSLPENIISISRTENQKQLAEIYSAADLFVNPTREENFPTVNIEALACGTPVITFKTGGSPEIIDRYSGTAVECDDFKALKTEIINILENDIFSSEDCRKRAEIFSKEEKFKEYVKLYEDIAHSPQRTL